MVRQAISRRFTCEAVANVAGSVHPASRHESATRAERSHRFITSWALRQLVHTADVRNGMWHLRRTVRTRGHEPRVWHPVRTCARPACTHGCSWLGCGTRSNAAAAVAALTSPARPSPVLRATLAPPRDTAWQRAMQAPRVRTSCRPRQLLRGAICETVWNAAPAAHPRARVRTCTHPWHHVCNWSRQCARVAAVGLTVARPPMPQRDGVAGGAASVCHASRHELAAHAVQAPCVISSRPLRQLVRTAMCEIAWNAAPAAHP